MTMSIERAFAHELGHLCAGMQAGAVRARIVDDGEWLRTELEWSTAQPSELAVAISWLGGTLAEPSAMSPEDKLMLAVMPKSLREEAQEFVERFTLPMVDSFDPVVIRSMIGDLVADGFVEVDNYDAPKLEARRR
jgi:hypothetical protein